MSIEELFRDHKGRRHGQSLRDTRIRHADRFDRFLLVVALAYILLMGLARPDCEPSAWCTNHGRRRAARSRSAGRWSTASTSRRMTRYK